MVFTQIDLEGNRGTATVTRPAHGSVIEIQATYVDEGGKVEKKWMFPFTASRNLVYECAAQLQECLYGPGLVGPGIVQYYDALRLVLGASDGTKADE